MIDLTNTGGTVTFTGGLGLTTTSGVVATAILFQTDPRQPLVRGAAGVLAALGTAPKGSGRGWKTQVEMSDERSSSFVSCSAV